MVVGVICWFYLTDRPRDAHWMPEDERRALVTEMDTDEEAKASRYPVSVRESLTRPRVWALAFVYFGGVYGLYALGFFLPTIIKGFETQYARQLRDRGARVHQRHPLRPRCRRDVPLVPAR